ncbi:hypothetical protein AVEN_114655-1 [Araneus ventricosus]|uniref:Uncharacterized protein n=1 Tax=Araneus ventricosus TaxID=182803 RepID=A0A4Y2NLE7_ARAVE|nr:hypothetical protein AVEN_114655-1 [Araneus ventricosus]
MKEFITRHLLSDSEIRLVEFLLYFDFRVYSVPIHACFVHVLRASIRATLSKHGFCRSAKTLGSLVSVVYNQKGSGSISDEICGAPYGLHPMYNAVVSTVDNIELLTSLADRFVNNEAMLLSFLAEKSLPFALVPDLLDLVKELSKDRKGLRQLKNASHNGILQIKVWC